MASKRYKAVAAEVDRTRLYTPKEALELVKKLASAKFDETVEVAFRLGINPKHADQQIRTTTSLPGGTGKTVRVAVVTKGEAEKAAKEAGADFVGSDELINQIAGGFMDFDLLIATQDVMPAVAKLGKQLGPRGLMPNLKTGTVVQPENIAKAVGEFKAGKIEVRNDRQGNVHVPIGKASFDSKALLSNFAAVVDTIQKAKPSTAKGTYMRSLTLTSTMGPGVKVDTAKLAELAHSE